MGNFNVRVCDMPCRQAFDNKDVPIGLEFLKDKTTLIKYPLEANVGLRRPYAPYTMITEP